MTKTVTALVATGLLGIASTAGAATVDLGSIASGDFVGGSLLSGSGNTIADQWTFTLDEDALTAISLDSNDAEPFFEITDFVASSSSSAIVFTYDASDNAYAFDGLLSAGTYTIDVSGFVSGDIAGQYDVLVGASVAPIPVPAAVWLFGSALLGLMTTRRQANA
ncbi:MAG: hypothetical protein AAGD86_02110 [Pseudomonadota bacterium]